MASNSQDMSLRNLDVSFPHREIILEFVRSAGCVGGVALFFSNQQMTRGLESQTPPQIIPISSHGSSTVSLPSFDPCTFSIRDAANCVSHWFVWLSCQDFITHFHKYRTARH